MRLKPRLLVLAAATIAAAALVAAPALGGGARDAKSRVSVSVRDDFFSPRSAAVSRGGKVVWRWRGVNPHNVRFRKVPRGAKRPKGSPTKTSGRFARTFSRRGTYRYVCTIHEDLGMKGRVKVG